MLGLKFYRKNIEYEIYQDTQILGKWKAILSKRINQFGFHDLFKVYKKIGKGSFASVYYAERIEDGLSVAVKAFNKEALYAEERGKVTTDPF